MGRCMPFEIDNNGSLSLRLAPAPIVDADDSWRMGSSFHTLLKLPMHRVIADVDAQTMQEPLGRPTSSRMPQMVDSLPGTRGTTCKRTCYC